SSIISNRATFLVPDYIKVIIKYKEAFYLGFRENIYYIIYINNIVDLFLLILVKYLEGKKELAYSRQGFYFIVSDSIP
ncbi:hypothetical protein F5882DRAFT_308061, partial [Hyaloscypha sp. PMI_1271]